MLCTAPAAFKLTDLPIAVGVTKTLGTDPAEAVVMRLGKLDASIANQSWTRCGRLEGLFLRNFAKSRAG